MGNGLRKAIKEERWGDVRPKLENAYRIRNKRYRGIGSKKTRSTKNIGILNIMSFLCTPDKEEVPRDERVTALHLVATRNAPIDIVQSILQIAPNLIATLSEPNKELPLHYAAKYPRSNPKMIQILIEAYPDACFQLSTQLNNNEDEARDSDGLMMTPLHMACRAQRNITILKALVDHSPDPAVLLHMQDRKGRTPFQVLMKHTHFWNVRYRRAARRILLPKEEQQRQQQQIEQQTEEFWDAVQDENVEVSVIVSPTETSDPVENNNTDIDGGLCVICWNDSASHAMVPCGHMCICRNCSNRSGKLLQSLNRKCPLCTKYVQNCIRIYS